MAHGSNSSPARSDRANSPAPILGPAKWFAAGALFAGSAAALVVLLIVRSPRDIAPLMATTVVTTSPEALSPVASEGHAEPVATPSDSSTSTPPREPRPLSPAITALLAPNFTTASSPAAPFKPLDATPPAAPSHAAPQPAPSQANQPTPAANPKPKPTPKAEPAAPPTQSKPTPAISGGTINVNTATSAELELLPQIGPALASRIIDYRTTNGPFKALADLDKVKGIGPKTLDKLKGLVRFD